jgi:enoyl-CoA hydratase
MSTIALTPMEYITVEHDEAVAILTFNRPQVLNAFNNELMHETLAAMGALDADPSVRAIVVRGAGRAFSAGFDLKASAERVMADVADWERQMTLQFDFIMQFWRSPKPTIAVVHGFCLAGAFELMLSCDVTVAAEGTRFGEPEVRFGTGIVAMLLPWITGPKQAKELLLTGDDRIDAADALRMGIINHVVPADAAFAKGMAIGRTMSRAAERSVRITKRAINAQYEAMGLSSGLGAALDMDILLNAGSSPEKKEFARIRTEQGVKAALTWRDARFR